MSKEPKTPKPKTELLIKLLELKEQWSDSTIGHRQSQYLKMEAAMDVAVSIRNKLDALAELRTTQEVVPLSKTLTSKNWITVAVVSIMTAAKTERAIKEARRRARALDYLYFSENVKIKDIAATLKKRGGIQKIVAAAAKNEPRRKVAKTGPAKVKVRLSKNARGVTRRMKDGDKIVLHGLRTVDGDAVLIKIVKASGVMDANDNDNDDDNNWD